MGVELAQLVADFAGGIKEVDSQAPQGRSRGRLYRAGIGPLSEKEAVSSVLKCLKAEKHDLYGNASAAAYPGERLRCDLVLPGQWAIEFKLVRPFGDNGKEAEHWSENLLHPYLGNVSAIGDCLKLALSEFAERKAIVIFAYEHATPTLDLNLAIDSFEVITREVLRLKLSGRVSSGCTGLIHPHHQRATVYGWAIPTLTEEKRAELRLRTLSEGLRTEVIGHLRRRAQPG